MVAYTSPDCLPYWEGTDSPCVNTGTLCDPSTVDCDFATVVEAKLDEFDAVVSVLESPPMAWVERLAGMTILVDTIGDEPVVFDRVRIDTANMVNLDAQPSAITITRTGFYTVFAYARGTTLSVPGNLVELFVITTALPALVNKPLTDTTPSVTQAINLNDVQLAPGIQYPTYYENGQVVSLLLNCNGNSGDRVITSKIGFGICWLGDPE